MDKISVTPKNGAGGSTIYEVKVKLDEPTKEFSFELNVETSVSVFHFPKQTAC
jgi:hypothetical protein